MMRYRCAIREIRTKLEVLYDKFSIKYNRNPISSIKSRIKTPLSIYNKLQRLGYDFTEQNIKEQLDDCACTITAVDKQMQNIKNLIEEYSVLTPR